MMGTAGEQGANLAPKSCIPGDDASVKAFVREVRDEIVRAMACALVASRRENETMNSPDEVWCLAQHNATHNAPQQSQQQQQIETLLVARGRATPGLTPAGGELVLDLRYKELALPLAFDTAGSFMEQLPTAVSYTLLQQAVMVQRQQCTLMKCLEVQCWQQRCNKPPEQQHRQLYGHVT